MGAPPAQAAVVAVNPDRAVVSSHRAKGRSPVVA